MKRSTSAAQRELSSQEDITSFLAELELRPFDVDLHMFGESGDHLLAQALELRRGNTCPIPRQKLLKSILRNLTLSYKQRR